jgi:hypothetical protein
MAKKIYEETDIQDIAVAIREQNDLTTLYKVADMSTAIRALKMAKDVLPQDEASGAIASFPDGSDDYPVVELTAAINAIQAGEGDPSPENVRPISGWTACKVTRTGKNLALLAESTKNDSQACTYVFENNGINITAINKYGRASFIVPVKSGQQYTISFYGYGTANFKKVYFNDSAEWLDSYGRISLTETRTKYTKTITATSDILFVGFYATNTGEDGNMIVEDFMVEVGDAATAYEAYNGTTYDIDFDQTIYGGTINATTGELTITHANIASYNGETINEPWISSMDVYESGATPTTGAQVVYPLTTPQTYQLTPTQVNTLLGENYIEADTGDVYVKYRADVDLYIQKKIGEAT